jgi:hypothetical protein
VYMASLSSDTECMDGVEGLLVDLFVPM